MNPTIENQEMASNMPPITTNAEFLTSRDIVYEECRKMIDTQVELQTQLEHCAESLQESELMRKNQEADLLEMQKKYEELYQTRSLEIAERQNVFRGMESNRAIIMEINKHCTDLVETISTINVEKEHLIDWIKNQAEDIEKLEKIFIHEKTSLETKIQQIQAEKAGMENQFSDEKRTLTDKISITEKQLCETIMKNNEKVSLLSKQAEFLSNLTKERDNLLSETELLKNANSHLESSLNDTVEKLKSSLSTIDELTAEIIPIKNELLTLNDEKQKLLESLEKSYETISNMKNECNEIITEGNSKLTQQKQLIESMSKKNEQLENSFTEYKNKIEIELKNEMTLKEQYICEIEKINKEKAELSTSILSLKERSEMLDKELKDAKSTISNQEAVQKVLESKLNYLNDHFEKLGIDMQNKEQTIKTLENKCDNLKQELEELKISEQNAVEQKQQMTEALIQNSLRSKKTKIRVPPTDSDSDSTESVFSHTKLERNYNALMRGEPGSPINFNAKTKKQCPSLPSSHHGSIIGFQTSQTKQVLKHMPPPNKTTLRPKKNKTAVFKTPEQVYDIGSD